MVGLAESKIGYCLEQSRILDCLAGMPFGLALEMDPGVLDCCSFPVDQNIDDPFAEKNFQSIDLIAEKDMGGLPCFGFDRVGHPCFDVGVFDCNQEPLQRQNWCFGRKHLGVEEMHNLYLDHSLVHHRLRSRFR